MSKYFKQIASGKYVIVYTAVAYKMLYFLIKA